MNPTFNTRGRLFVTPAEALYCPEFLGLPPPQNPQSSAAQLLTRRRFPLPTMLVCGRRMVKVADILSFAMSSGVAGAPALPASAAGSEPRRGRGRPSKAELATRAAARGREVGHE